VRRLIGVGVGPGDPELITVKAIRVLRTADLVLVPVLGRPGEEDRAETGRAEATVRAHVDGAVIRRVAFALNATGGVTPDRAAAWDAAAER
jgi:precorrin-2/cobalt-factor-2 C20-methyltransferase